MIAGQGRTGQAWQVMDLALSKVEAQAAACVAHGTRRSGRSGRQVDHAGRAGLAGDGFGSCRCIA